MQKSRIIKTIFKKEKFEGFILADFKTEDKATLIKRIWYL